jgi:3D (Asp-Asp-Asp) domain-containing protein
LAIVVVAVFALTVPALAQTTVVSDCCEYAGSCTDGKCPTPAPGTTGGRNHPNLVCRDGKSCGPAPIFSSAPADATNPLPETAGPKSTPVIFIPNSSIPGSQFERGVPVSVTGTTIGDYIAAFYAWFAGAAGVLAVFMVMYGGFKWITAAGNPGRIGEAKETITGAIIGLVLLLGSYVLLSTISPSFVNFKDLSSLLDPVKPNYLVEPDHFAIGLLGNSADVSIKDQFNGTACPTIDQMKAGFDAFVTGYYRPDRSDAGGYGDPMCNIAMQCSCQTTKNATCGPVSGYKKTWSPCQQPLPGDYCTHTAWEAVSNTAHPPQDLLTAASSRCFGFGTRFTIANAPSSIGSTSKEWTVNDRGGDIKGTHFDLYTGTGDSAKAIALQLRTVVRIKVTHYCAPNSSCPN